MEITRARSSVGRASQSGGGLHRASCSRRRAMISSHDAALARSSSSSWVASRSAERAVRRLLLSLVRLAPPDEHRAPVDIDLAKT
eukprot:4776637-Prymnesium_polylepis.1